MMWGERTTMGFLVWTTMIVFGGSIATLVEYAIRSAGAISGEDPHFLLVDAVAGIGV